MTSNITGLKTNVPLAPLTTYRIGGPADYFVSVNSTGSLIAAINEADSFQLPYFILGTGANVLIADAGYRGLVIHNQAARVEWLAGDRLKAESGASIASLIEQSQRHGLSGLEHFAGIPSSAGGAMRQNLHFLAPDRKSTVFIAELVEAATILMFDGTVKTVDRDFFQFGYDDSILHHEPMIVLDVTFQLKPQLRADIQAQIKVNLAWRNTKQPQLAQYPSCGSVFKKIEGAGAGRLIEQSGLKGFTIGNIQVSDKHANYLVNLGGGTAAEVMAVIQHIQATVKQVTSFQLEPEIGFVGFID